MALIIQTIVNSFESLFVAGSEMRADVIVEHLESLFAEIETQVS